MMVSAQIGSKLKSVISYTAGKNILKTEVQGAYIMQDIQTAQKELTTVIYNMDSMAVAISLQRTDTFFSVDEIEQYIKINTPEYKPERKAVVENVSYHWDTAHQVALIIHYESREKGLGITNFVLCKDQALITYWTKAVTAWVTE